MGFIYWKEKALFLREWRIKQKMMVEAGMDEHAILKMLQYDWEWFKSIRKYNKRRVDIDIAKLYSPQIEFADLELIDTLDDMRLFNALQHLSDENLEILIKFFIQEYRQVEIAREKGVDKSVISRKIKAIREKIQNIDK